MCVEKFHEWAWLSLSLSLSLSFFNSNNFETQYQVRFRASTEREREREGRKGRGGTGAGRGWDRAFYFIQAFQRWMKNKRERGDIWLIIDSFFLSPLQTNFPGWRDSKTNKALCVFRVTQYRNRNRNYPSGSDDGRFACQNFLPLRFLQRAVFEVAVK